MTGKGGVDMKVASKAVLITGASSGIGWALAENLAAKGARLALLARRAGELERIAGQLTGKGAVAVAVPADVTKPDEVGAAVEKAVGILGGLDMIVNNAGFGYFGTVAGMSMTDFDTMVKTNVYGLLHVTQAAFPHLKRSKGMIVNVSSGLSKRTLPFLSAYVGTKSMVNTLSDGMRMELRKYGIRVLNYCPPEVDTGFADRAKNEEGLEMPEDRRKRARVEDVAEDLARAIVAGKREVVKGKALMVMNLFAPKLVDYIFYKAMVLKLSRD